MPKAVNKQVVVEGEIVFENLYTKIKRGAGDTAKEVYDIVLKIPKGSESAKKLRVAFTSLIRETKPVKILKEANAKGKLVNVKKDVKTSAGIFWDAKVSDGDEDEYWSQKEYNHGHWIIQPFSKNKVPVWKKEGKTMKKTDMENFVGWRDQVRIMVTWSKGHYTGDYVTLYLNGVTVLEKGADYTHEEAVEKALSGDDMEIAEDKDMEEELGESSAESSTNKSDSKSEDSSSNKSNKSEEFDDVDFDSETEDEDDIF